MTVCEEHTDEHTDELTDEHTDEIPPSSSSPAPWPRPPLPPLGLVLRALFTIPQAIYAVRTTHP